MKLRGLFPFLLGSLATGLALSGCLPEPEPVDGDLIAAGIAIEKPHFEIFDNGDKKEPWVVYGVRKALPVNGYGARVDLHRVRWEDRKAEVIVTDYADRPEWGVAVDARKVRYYMKDERNALDGGAAAVGTLNRISLTAGIVETIPDVTSFSLDGSGSLYQYRKYVPGSRFQELRL